MLPRSSFVYPPKSRQIQCQQLSWPWPETYQASQSETTLCFMYVAQIQCLLLVSHSFPNSHSISTPLMPTGLRFPCRFQKQSFWSRPTLRMSLLKRKWVCLCAECSHRTYVSISKSTAPMLPSAASRVMGTKRHQSPRIRLPPVLCAHFPPLVIRRSHHSSPILAKSSRCLNTTSTIFPRHIG